MYEPKPADPGEKPFKCEDIPPRGAEIPTATQPFRELLDALTNEVKKLTPPNEASTKFPDELKDIEKEYQGIDAIVAKYKEFYDKQLDCKLADVKRWREKIREWSSTVDPKVKKCIEDYRKTKYDNKEDQICCEWVKLRRELNALSDPLAQAKNKEALKQEAYDKLKGFLDTVTKIFTDLEALFKKADGFNKEEKTKSVYAVSLEFEDLYCLIDWPKTDEENCPVPKPNGGTGGQPQPTGGYAQQPPSTPPSGEYATTPPHGYGQSQEPSEGSAEGHDGCSTDPEQVKKKLMPTEFRARLICALRGLVLAKFDRLKIHHQLLKAAAEAEAKKAAVEAAKKECDKFRADRQKLFLDLAEDIPCEKGNGGGGEPQPSGGGYGQQPSGGGYGQQQPPGEGYGKQPPGGGYQQQPPGGGQQQPPSGGYEPQTPSGGYEKPSKGYDKK